MLSTARYPLILVFSVMCVFPGTAAPYPREQMKVVLLPIATLPVPGAFGTLWWADLRVHNASDEDVPFHQGGLYCGIPGCINAIRAHETEIQEMPARTEGFQGRLAYVDKEKGDRLFFSCDLWVSSSGRDHPVSEIPVVGEEDFLRGGGVLPAVPLHPERRITLRIYDAEPNTPDRILMRVYPALPGPLGAPIVSETFWLIYPGVGFGDDFLFPDLPGILQLDDLASRYPAILAYDAVQIHVQSEPADQEMALWFYATVTDNGTQSVVNYTPNGVR